jgi:hypothetical protein
MYQGLLVRADLENSSRRHPLFNTETHTRAIRKTILKNFIYANARKKTPLEIHFMYFGNKNFYCVFWHAA